MSLDYRPDTPTLSPTTLITAQFLLADKSGNYRTSYSATAVANWSTAFTQTPLSARMVQFSDGTPNVFFGSNSSIYEWNGSTLSTVTRAAGGNYLADTTHRWWFEQFGDSTIASNLNDNTQVRTSSSSGTQFADLSGAPKAKFFLSQRGYLLACSYNDGSAVLNGIKWATQGSTTSWTAATGNTAGNAILRETPGEIIAGAQIHDIVAIWKKNSMYIGRIIGGAGTNVWEFNLLSPKIGCAGLDAWASTPVGIIFVSPNNGVYKFDGSVPVPIDQGIRNELYRGISTATQCKVSHDEASQTVFLWFGSTSGCPIAYAYNYASNKWSEPYVGSVLGNASFTNMQCAIRDANYDDYIALGGTNAGNRRAHLIVSSEKKVCNLADTTAGAGVNAAYTFASVRDPKAGPDDLTQITRVEPVHAYDTENSGFVGEPSSGTLTISDRPRIGAASTANGSYSMDANRRYDCSRVANSFALTFSHTAQTMILADMLFNTQLSGSA